MKPFLLALLLPALAAGAFLWPHRDALLHPEPRRLLVAVDTLTGEARGVQLLTSERTCVAMSAAPAWPALLQLKTTERLECRAPK